MYKTVDRIKKILRKGIEFVPRKSIHLFFFKLFYYKQTHLMHVMYL